MPPCRPPTADRGRRLSKATRLPIIVRQGPREGYAGNAQAHGARAGALCAKRDKAAIVPQERHSTIRPATRPARPARARPAPVAHGLAASAAPPETAPARDRPAPHWWRFGLPLLFLALTLLFLWPLPPHLRSATISADSPDIWIHLWWMWQVREAILAGQNPYETVRVFHPTGAPLYLMGQDMLTALLSIPFQGFLGLVPTYNLLTIAATAFTCWTATLFAHEVTGSRPGAVVAGLIFGFAPLQATFLNLGQMEYVNLGFLPLAAFSIVRLRRDPRPRIAVPGGVCALLTLLSSWYQALFLLLFVALFVLYEGALLVWARRWSEARACAIALIIWGVTLLALASPVLLPAVRLASNSSFAVTSRFNISYSSIEVRDPFLPNRLNPSFGAGRETVASALGYVALALAGLGLWRAWRRGIFWALMTVVFYLLALGPYLKVGGRQWFLPFLPYNILYGLPLGNIARVPSRFLILITLALSVLAAYAVGWLTVWLAARWPRRAAIVRVAVPVLVAVLVLAEVFPAPRALADTAVEPIYERLRPGPPGAVYELPYDDRALAMYRATVHERPLIGGYVSRPVPYPLLNGVPIIADLRNRPDSLLRDLAGPDIVEQPAPIERAVAMLDTYSIRHVILRRDAHIPADELARLAEALERLLPADLITYDAGPIRVYTIPHAPRSGVVAGFGSGWYAIERRADTGGRFRWTNGDATMPLTLLDDAPQIVTIGATIFTYARPATVDVFLDDRLITTVAATGAQQQIALTLPLAHGYNGLRFRAREAPIVPSALGGARDDRTLSFALADMRFVTP
jgi:hypothetical protein